MSGNIIDTDFFNRLAGDQASQEAFHLLRRKMFEADAEASKAKAEAQAKAETARAEEAKAKADKAKELEELRNEYFAKYGSDFLTDNLIYAGEAKDAAEKAGLRFSSYLEMEKNGSGDVVAVKVKCVARQSKKK